MESKRRVISLLVDNQSGVLARVSNLFCRRGFNIDSLTVSATNDPTVSRITVTITSDEKALSQLILQTERLEVTGRSFVLDHDKCPGAGAAAAASSGCRCPQPRVSCGRSPASTRPRSLIFRDSMVLELTGTPEKVDAFLKIMFADYKILELCRTGVTAWSAAGCTSTCRSPAGGAGSQLRCRAPLPAAHKPLSFP